MHWMKERYRGTCVKLIILIQECLCLCPYMVIHTETYMGYWFAQKPYAMCPFAKLFVLFNNYQTVFDGFQLAKMTKKNIKVISVQYP